MSLPTKTGWYRARWPQLTTWSCVLVTVTGSVVSVYDPGASRWRPLSDVDEWGPCIDDMEAEVVSLLGYFVAMTVIADDAHRRCEELRDELAALFDGGDR